MPFDLQEFFDRLNQHILSATSPNNNRDILFCFRIYEVLKKQAQELNETLPEREEFKSFKQSLTKLQAEQGSISSGEVQKYLWQFFYICHSILPLSDAGARVADKTLIPIYKCILNSLYVLTNFQGFCTTENKFDSFITAFRTTEDIFVFSGLSVPVSKDLVNEKPNALELAQRFCLKQPTEPATNPTPKNLIALFNSHIEYNSKIDTASQTKRIFSVFIFVNFSHHIKDVFPNDDQLAQKQPLIFSDLHQKLSPANPGLQDSFKDDIHENESFESYDFESYDFKNVGTKTYLTRYNVYQNALIKDAWFKYFFALSQSDKFKEVYQSDQNNKLDPNDKNNLTHAATMVSELAKLLPKNIASGTHTAVQKPLKNILKLPAWVINIITGNKEELASELIKAICRFYLTMQPYTPEALSVLVELYRHTFNKFINLDHEIHHAIFANRDLLTSETALEFIYWSFQCQKEKKTLNKEMLRYLSELKEILPDKTTRKDNEEITLKDVIASSQDCVIQTRQYDFYIPTTRLPSSTEIVQSSNNYIAKKNYPAQQKKQLEPEERKRIINNLIRLIQETIDVEYRFANSMKKFSAGMEKHEERIPELAKGGDLLKSIIPHCKAVAKNLFSQISITLNGILSIKNQEFTLLTERLTEINLNTFKSLAENLIEIFTSEDFNEYVKNISAITTAYYQLSLPHGACYFGLPAVIKFANQHEDDYGNKESEAGQGITGQLIKPAVQQLPRYKMLIINMSKTFNDLYPAENNAENKDIKEIHIMMNYLSSYLERILGNANDAKRPPDPAEIEKLIVSAQSYSTLATAKAPPLALPSTPDTVKQPSINTSFVQQAMETDQSTTTSRRSKKAKRETSNVFGERIKRAYETQALESSSAVEQEQPVNYKPLLAPPGPVKQPIIASASTTSSSNTKVTKAHVAAAIDLLFKNTASSSASSSEPIETQNAAPSSSSSSSATYTK